MRLRSQSGQPNVEKDNLKFDPAEEGNPDEEIEFPANDSREPKTGCTNMAATASAEVDKKSFLETLGIIQG